MTAVDLVVAVAALSLAAGLWLYLYREETLAAWWYRLRDTETYEPAAAEAPESCGCRAVSVHVGCMHCGYTSCQDHRAHTCVDADGVERAYRQTGLAFGWLRAKPFTGEERPARRLCVAHLRVGGLTDTQVADELIRIVNAGLADLWAAPARLEALYLVPEVER